MTTKSIREEYEKYFSLEKPFGWMIEELVNSLYEKDHKIQGNYLTAIGLFCYSEVIGREIMHYKNPQVNKDKFRGRDCFNLFLREYMGYKKIIDEYPKIYEWYRHGLCHEYRIKGNGETGVFVYYDILSVQKFNEIGIDTTKGILLLERYSNKRIFLLLPYLKDFAGGIIKFLHEKDSA